MTHRTRAPRHLDGRIPIAKRLINNLVVVPCLVRLGLLFEAVHAGPVPRRRTGAMVDVVDVSEGILSSLPARRKGPVLIRVRREPKWWVLRLGEQRRA